MKEFEEYLRGLGLCEKSVRDDMSRIRSMTRREVDYTKGEQYAKEQLQKTDLSDSTIGHCVRLCRRYREYINSSQKNLK